MPSGSGLGQSVHLLESSTRSPAPLGALILSAVFVVLGLLIHLLFRTGRGLRSDKGQGRRRVPAAQAFDIQLAYAALPATVAFAAATCMLAISRYATSWSKAALLVTSLPLVAVFVGAGAWTVKEFYRPSAFRTPSWLREEQDRGRRR